MNRYIVVLLFLFFTFSTCFAQEIIGKEKAKSFFGFQIKPIFPAVFMGTTKKDISVKNFNTSIRLTTSYSFGAVVRAGITKLIAIETGINLTQRNYKLNYSIPDSNIYLDSRLRYVTYDIPVAALFYIRLAKPVYMNVSIGAALSYNPTAAGIKNMPGGYHDFRQLALGKKLVGEALGNVGFEYRTEKAGVFYLGAEARIPFSPLFYLKSEYRYQGYQLETDAEHQGKINGSYLALQIKYFFPISTIKGSPVKRPIEQ
ncbi:MAG: PorT family protein [Crocinitomicaceae bacterium]|nr:PorT family protein [Crocinitomicaceae bacterium]